MWRVPTFLGSSCVKNSLRFLPLSSEAPGGTFPGTATLLKSRGLLRVRGSEVTPFLQGLITNDISHLEQKPCIFTLFLNHQGRVLFDALLYKGLEGELLVECDASFRSKLISHLKLYRLKRKIEIDGEDKLQLWVINGVDPSLNKFRSLISCVDPRASELGWRVITQAEEEGTPSSIAAAPSSEIIGTEEEYKRLRYTLGVAEGVSELPFANAFPLEANGDYLHGVSFHKGCYIGQELTARTHHTGVVRKRIMPFRLSDPKFTFHGDSSNLQIINEKDRPVGKVRGLLGALGIALFRVEETLSASSLTLNGVNVAVQKPKWWPIEAAKKL